MSEWLTSSVPPNRALRLLSQIDDECANATLAHDFHFYHGPFGAFRLSQNLSVPSHGFLHEPKDTQGPVVPAETDDDIVDIPQVVLSPWIQQLMQLDSCESESDYNLSFTDFVDISGHSSRIQEIFEGLTMPEINEFSLSARFHEDFPSSQLLTNIQAPSQSSPTSFSSVSTSSTNNDVPQDTVLLLKHYATAVISSLSPFHHSKTPWHVLFLPLAKNCLAALTLGERVDHAVLSAFYGTLAISAFSLGIIYQAQIWLERGEAYKKTAREHIKLTLQTAYQTPKAAKYKSILIALLTMAQVTTFSGRFRDTEYFLLEAEKFIRLKGLNRKKSRKVRLLHHCYVYMRMFHESTFGCVADKKQRQLVRRAVEKSGLVINGQDSMSFRLTGWSDLHQEMLRVKNHEEHENDLHLEQPGICYTTLYPEIYGIPESWFYMFSAVIRLGNEKDAIGDDTIADVPTLKQFFARAKAVEKCINQFSRPDQGHGQDVTLASQTPRDPLVLDDIVDGMQCALALYFYRRVYDLDACLLQGKVMSIRDWLVRYEAAHLGAVNGSIGLIWPAFIGACEAEDSDVRESFSSWFRNTAQRSGLPYYSETFELVQQVWQEKAKTNGTSTTWLDLMRKNVLLQQHS